MALAALLAAVPPQWVGATLRVAADCVVEEALLGRNLTRALTFVGGIIVGVALTLATFYFRDGGLPRGWAAGRGALRHGGMAPAARPVPRVFAVDDGNDEGGHRDEFRFRLVDRHA